MKKNLAIESQEVNLLNLIKEAQNNLSDLAFGLNKYSTEKIELKEIEFPSVMKFGSSEVIDYANENTDHKKPIILFVPSLINKSYILDLDEDSSFIRFMGKQGFHPLLLDWKEPKKTEQGFSAENYIERLIKVIEQLKVRYNKDIVLAGYCMGGMFTLAASQLIQEKIKALVMLSAPWDFHSRDTERINLSENALVTLDKIFSAAPNLDKNIVQMIFYLLQPVYVHNKYKAFANMNLQSSRARKFIAVENWINDGVAMSANLAKECFVSWAHENITMLGKWKILGEKISPEKIKIPTLAVLPKNDRVVPELCSAALANKIKNCDVIKPDAGHVGMIAGSNAKTELWQPFAKWLEK